MDWTDCFLMPTDFRFYQKELQKILDEQKSNSVGSFNLFDPTLYSEDSSEIQIKFELPNINCAKYKDGIMDYTTLQRISSKENIIPIVEIDKNIEDFNALECYYAVIDAYHQNRYFFNEHYDEFVDTNIRKKEYSTPKFLIKKNNIYKDYIYLHI